MSGHREALVVGINDYPLTDKLKHLKKPAVDAEAIAQILEKYGNFTVRRLPEVCSPEGTRGVDPNPPPQNLVEVTDLQEAIAQLFNPQGKSIPNTSLLFFAGHGWQKKQGGVTEGFLATSYVNPDEGKWGLSLGWLRQLLQESPVRQQVIWLDCCHSGELLDILDEANPRKKGKTFDRCLIAACRGFEESREKPKRKHGILTDALLQGLDPDGDVDGWVSNNKLADFINRQMSAELQRPMFHNSGGAIILTDKTHGIQRQIDGHLQGKCPYKALEYFTQQQEDAIFFSGRTALTDELIDLVRTENFIAVLGASGSGKSSVLRAGLLYQLKRGQKLSGSDRWQYYGPFTPGEHPGEILGELGIGELGRWGDAGTRRRGEVDRQNSPSASCPLPPAFRERTVLVIDQFEECFTMCRDEQEREEFFACLLQAVEQSNNQLCLVLGMRADFLGKCAEYRQLAEKIDRYLVTVKPMTKQEIEEAIKEPAEKVGLKVEKALVTKMKGDVIDSPGSLPLLQYTLTELWNQAKTSANPNRLTLESYDQLGGIEKTLPQRANQVYNSLKDEEKSVAKRIFLELTQLGEASDTRRRVRKQDLVNPQHSEELLDRTIEQLVQAKLIVTSNESQPSDGKPGVILDIVHEALIRHWRELRQWVKENQVALEKERKIEARAKEWELKGKKVDFLLRGAELKEAETYLEKYLCLGLLDGIAQEYIEVSQNERTHLEKAEKERQDRELKAIRSRNRTLVGSLVVVSAAAIGALLLWQLARQQTKIAKLRENAARVQLLVQIDPVEALARAIQLTGESQALASNTVLPQVQSSLRDAIAEV
ncbi:MAG: caspase family protein, partial [Coleofasciculaceae cyanobacterium]